MVHVIVRCTSCGNVFASFSPIVPLQAIVRLVTLLQHYVTCWRRMLRPGSGHGKKRVASRSGAAKWVKRCTDKRKPETLPDSGSEIYDPEGAARLVESELAKRWNVGVRKTPITSDSATTDLGGKLPPRPWLTNSPAVRAFAHVDWSVFGEFTSICEPR